MRKDKVRQTIQLGPGNNKVKFEILLDKSSLEVFVNGGEQVLTTYIYPSENANGLKLFSRDGKAVMKNIKIWDMSPVKQ